MADCVNLKNTLFCRAERAYQTHPYSALGFVCVHVYACVNRVRQGSRECFPCQWFLLFQYTIDKDIIYPKSDCCFVSMEMGWISSGRCQKTAHEWANTIRTVLHYRLTNWIISAAGPCQNNQLQYRQQYCQKVKLSFVGRYFGMHRIRELSELWNQIKLDAN